MTLIEIFSILLIHWVADFVLQTDSQAKGKSKNWKDLLNHTFNYSMVWMIPITVLFGLSDLEWTAEQYVLHSVIFCLITFVTHTTTDYFTSRLNAKLWAKGDSHNFFISVGFDQVLHYVQLFLTYWFLTGKN